MFSLSLVIQLTIKNVVFKKDNCKKYIFVVFSLSDLKMIFILLIEVIIFYMQIYIIEIRILGFERLI